MEQSARRSVVLIVVLVILLAALGGGMWRLWTHLREPTLPSVPSGALTNPTDQAGRPSTDGTNPLKLPPLLEDQDGAPGQASYVLNAQAGRTEFFPGVQTATIGYEGSYLGPLIRLKRGENVSIQVNNQLRDRTTMHWHGLAVDGEQDGGPHQGIQPGASWTARFTVDQPAATLWFHPHLAGTTANQVHDGLAGLIYIEDDISSQLALPVTYGVDDFPLIVQDRSFNRNGSFRYQTNMMGVVPGDTILINGTVNPYVTVPRGLVRFRILNASNAQTFTFRMSDGSPFQQIASDGGLLAAPVTRPSIFLASAERAEVVVDFSRIQGKTVALLLGNLPILTVRIDDAGTGATVRTELPQALAAVEPIPPAVNPRVRVFEMQAMGISGTINGKTFDMDRIDEVITRNETETWIVRTLRGMGMMQADGHPFHVHGTQFQIISRNGRPPPPEEQGFKDTVFVRAGEEVELRVRFSHPGLFMFHCHILEHEDNGMMGQFVVE